MKINKQADIQSYIQAFHQIRTDFILPKLFICPGIDEAGHVISNNLPSYMDWTTSVRRIYEADILDRVITLDKLSEDTHNYVFVIDIDYSRDNKYGNTLVEYYEKYNIIPPEVLILMQQGRCLLIIDEIFEAYSDVHNLMKIHELLVYYSIPPGNCVYIDSSPGASELYDRMCVDKNIPDKITIRCTPTFLMLASAYVKHSRNTIVDSPYEIDKKFMCLNNSFRPHRLIFVLLLLHSSKHLINEMYISFPKIDIFNSDFKQTLLRILVTNDSTYLRYNISDREPRTVPYTGKLPNVIFDKDVIDEFYEQLPLEVDKRVIRYNTLYEDLKTDIIEYYQKCLFNIVTESHFNQIEYDCSSMFLTEKILKPMIYKQIPILIGPFHLIRLMRNLGFDMFDDIVDHSYDDIVCSDTRLVAVIDEVNKINDKYSIQDVRALRAQLDARLCANVDRLRSFNIYEV